MTKKAKTYSAEFKAEAIKKIQDNDGNISATAREIDVPMQTLSNWHKKAQASKLAGTNNYDPELTAILRETNDLNENSKSLKRSEIH